MDQHLAHLGDQGTLMVEVLQGDREKGLLDLQTWVVLQDQDILPLFCWEEGHKDLGQDH